MKLDKPRQSAMPLAPIFAFLAIGVVAVVTLLATLEFVLHKLISHL